MTESSSLRKKGIGNGGGVYSRFRDLEYWVLRLRWLSLSYRLSGQSAVYAERDGNRLL